MEKVRWADKSKFQIFEANICSKEGRALHISTVSTVNIEKSSVFESFQSACHALSSHGQNVVFRQNNWTHCSVPRVLKWKRKRQYLANHKMATIITRSVLIQLIWDELDRRAKSRSPFSAEQLAENYFQKLINRMSSQFSKNITICYH